MNFDSIEEYAIHFLQCGIDFLGTPLGIVVIAMAITFFIVYLFEDLRR